MFGTTRNINSNSNNNTNDDNNNHNTNSSSSNNNKLLVAHIAGGICYHHLERRVFGVHVVEYLKCQ